MPEREQYPTLVEHFALLDRCWTSVSEQTRPEDRLEPERGVSVPLSEIYRRVPLPGPVPPLEG